MAFQLFENDSDEDEDSEAEEEIIVKPQFQGKEGEKVGTLMNLFGRIFERY